MDTTEPQRGASEEVDPNGDHSPVGSPQGKQDLPDDLPKSLDDRRSVPVFQETEIYDAWQGGRPFRCCLNSAQRLFYSPTMLLSLRLTRAGFNRTIAIPDHSGRRETAELQPHPR